MTVFSEKRCIPCEGGVPPLEKKEIDKLLVQLQSEWQVNALGPLYKKYKFSNFIKAMEFANKITEIAEQEAQHPDLTISWGACSVEIWTHKIDGLMENDFILAAKIESKI
ncbi:MULTISPECIES: 4a-hydroxytetrahydrobiopterin dehydratase [spotted fever group]|uniref:4a-hydroxytetrahydrobiopterin dehydratase n=1 Tax=Rickettsia philipii (strain 364D) TaxID=481009 RepID=H6PSV1_RICP3|nr:4a-hydroxytetrahydrobiopterin dehydratase [Rickettsia philipii]AFB25948.1 putative pterin-4-alpha-carbinolamine dehydratase [Rickettsia philipii str. 364D]